MKKKDINSEYDNDQEFIDIGINNQLDSTIKEIKHKIRQGYKNIEHENNTVLVLGNTGVGKSTLVNYLAGAELLAEKKGFGKMLISVPKPISSKMKVSHKLVSETSIPNSWKDAKTKTVYWDCPGFGDNRGPVQDISNAFYIKKLFELSKSTKIILVTTESSFIEGRGVNFANLIGSLSELFKDTKTLNKSLSLIVTKASHGSEVIDVQSAIKEILNDQAELLSNKTNQWNVLKHLSENADNIALFRSPKKKGKIPDDNRKEIVSVINKAKPLSDIEVNVSVSDKSKLYVNDLISAINNDIYLQMSDFAKILSNKAKDLVQNFDFVNFQDSLKMINQLHDLGNKSSEIASYKGKDQKEELLDFLNKFKLFPKNILSNIKENIQYLKFCKQILPSDKDYYSVSFWLSPIKTTAAKINHQGGYIDSLEGRVKNIVFDSTSTLFKTFNLEIQKVFKSIVLKASNNPMKYLVLKKYTESLDSIKSLLNDKSVSPSEINNLVTKEFIDNFDIKFEGWGKLVSYIYLMDLVDQDKSGRYINYLKTEFTKISLLTSYKDEVNSLSQSFNVRYKEYTDKFYQKILSCFENSELEIAKETKETLSKTIKNIDLEKNISLSNLLVHLKNVPIGKVDIEKILKELSVLTNLSKKGINVALPDKSILASKLKYLSHQVENLYKNLSEKKVIEFNKSIEFFTKSIMLDIMKVYYSLQEKKDSKLKLELLKSLKENLLSDNNDLSKVIDYIKKLPIKDFNPPELNKIQSIFDEVKHLQFPEKVLKGEIIEFWGKELAKLIDAIENDVQKDVEMEEAKNAIDVLSSNIEENLKTLLEESANIKVFSSKLEILKKEVLKVTNKSIGLSSEQFVKLVKSNIGYESFKHRKAVVDKKFKTILSSDKLKIDKSILESWNKLDDIISDEIDWYNNLLEVYRNLINPSVEKIQLV